MEEMIVAKPSIVDFQLAVLAYLTEHIYSINADKGAEYLAKLAQARMHVNYNTTAAGLGGPH
jgi:hypothetical protein